MKFGDVKDVGMSNETRLKVFQLTLRDKKVRLQIVRGIFCNIWHVSWAPMSRSTSVSERNF